MTGAGIITEIQRFHRNIRHLRKLQTETLQAIEDVYLSSSIKDEQLADLRFNEKEIEDLRKVLSVPTCLVIMGQDSYGKVAIVTRLLKEQVLPLVPTCVQSGPSSKLMAKPWRPIRIKHGVERKCRIIYPNCDIESSLNDNLDDNLSGASIHMAPHSKIEFENDQLNDPEEAGSIAEITMKNPLLKDGVLITVTPTCSPAMSRGHPNLNVLKFIHVLIPKIFPIVLYAITREELDDDEIAQLKEFHQAYPDIPVLFIRVPALPETYLDDLPEYEQHDILCGLGILPSPIRPGRGTSHSVEPLPPEQQESNMVGSDSPKTEEKSTVAPKRSCSITRLSSIKGVSEEIFRVLCEQLGMISMKPLPKRFKCLPHQEQRYHIDSELLGSLELWPNCLPYMRLLLQAQLIKASTLLHQGHTRCMRTFILYAFDMAREIQITPRRIVYAKEKETELYESFMAIALKKQDELKSFITQSIEEMKEQLLQQAEDHNFKNVDVPDSLEVPSTDIQLCISEIQDLVIGALNSAVGKQLVTKVEIMRDSYLGTLQRCLESLEKDCRDCGENPRIVDALKQMVNAAYQVEVTVNASSSVLRSFWEKMKQIVANMPGRTPPKVDGAWKRGIALDMIDGLSEARLARSICTQFKERLKSSHEMFIVSMKQMEMQLNSRLEQTEEQQKRIKKIDAPKLARMSLESTSLRDMILYGMPRLDREIGRGQYGVVYSCETWGGLKPCAVKSLVPLDEKHWNDLAMEFHYTRSVPDHERIVAVRGSVIDYTYGQGETPAVLLIMDRLNKDLYNAIRAGMHFDVRLQVAQDVTQGIRFLHSQGLVHRDIKLKNVLLDKQNRAKLTDLGFCKPEAMMSGSIVGTPIHMAPELFTGHYDNSVDVYAFGILFWYICAGSVKLPLVFEQCTSKDQLWVCVKKGARPEKLPQFDDESWNLMQECWDGDPLKRPLLGTVEPRLQTLHAYYREKRLEASQAKKKPQLQPKDCEVNDLVEFPLVHSQDLAADVEDVEVEVISLDNKEGYLGLTDILTHS